MNPQARCVNLTWGVAVMCASLYYLVTKHAAHPESIAHSAYPPRTSKQDQRIAKQLNKLKAASKSMHPTKVYASPLDAEKLCSQKQTPRAPLNASQRCIFIDTDGSIGESTWHFETFTPFAAFSCLWEVWHFGSVTLKARLALNHLKETPGVEVRLFAKAAASPTGKTMSRPPADFRWSATKNWKDATELGMLMLANLDRQDHITVALHADAALLNHTASLVESLGALGVADWVDKWMVDSGFSLHYTIPHILRETLRRAVPHLRFNERMRNPQAARSAHRVMHIVLPEAQEQGPTWPKHLLASVVEGRRHVFLDFGMKSCDTILQFMSYTLDPQSWEVWGFEASPANLQQALELCSWIEQHYPLGLTEADEVDATTGLRRIHALEKAVWTKDTQLTFQAGHTSVSGSVVAKSKNRGEETEVVLAVDIVKWMKSNFKESDFIFLKMDIEGSEYPVLHRMMLDGLACWVNKYAVEFHDVDHYAREFRKLSSVRRSLILFAQARGVEVALLE